MPFKLILILIFFIAAGCSHTLANQLIEDEPSAILSPIHVEATEKDGELTLDAYDAEELFARAATLLRGGNYQEAAWHYEKLISVFPDSLLVMPSLYNKGLCLDHLGFYAKAITAYITLIRQFPQSKELVDAWFRLAGSYEKLEAWEEVNNTLDELLRTSKDLSALDRIEALARKGKALLKLGNEFQAKEALAQAIYIYRRDKTITPTSPDYYYSMAQFKLAQIVHDEMRQISLPADDNKLEEILEKKCQLLLDSQNLYTKVIEIGNPHWSGAAAYRTGALYHHLWEDILAAPAPYGLDDLETEVYMDILRKRIKILLEKAIIQWERTIRFAIRLQLDNSWIENTRKDLEKIQTMLEIENTIGLDLPVD